MKAPNIESADALARQFDDFDYRVELDDFLLYELGRLIEADQASFEDEDFRRVIDEGIHLHVEESIEIRTEIAARVRASLPTLDAATARIASRTIRALEDVEFPLLNVSLVVRTYTAYLFRRLQEAADQPADPEEEARALINRWGSGEVPGEEMTKRVKEIGGPAVGAIADMLFDNPDDRLCVETAIGLLAGIRTSASARVLAHIIAEPALPEDLEIQAYSGTKSMWPMPRHFILHNIAPHTHEDLSFRWFQILVECDELAAVDMILDEVLMHSDSPPYTEDLKAILELLRLSHDPEAETKLLGILNEEETSDTARALLEDFASRFTPSEPARENAWTKAATQLELNRKYQKAAKLFESGKTDDCHHILAGILKIDPTYPFALKLQHMMG